MTRTTDHIEAVPDRPPELLGIEDPEGIPEGVQLTPMPTADREHWGDADWRLYGRRRLEVIAARRMAGHFEMVAAVLEIEERHLYADGFPSMSAYFEHTFGRTWATGRRWLAQAKELRASAAPSPQETAGHRARTPRGLTQGEATKRQAARRRGEDPGPPPSEAERIAKKASKRQPAPFEPGNGEVPSRGAPPPPRRQEAPTVTLYRRFLADLRKLGPQRFHAQALDDQAGGDALSREVKDEVLRIESERVQLRAGRLGGGTGGRS